MTVCASSGNGTVSARPELCVVDHGALERQHVVLAADLDQWNIRNRQMIEMAEVAAALRASLQGFGEQLGGPG